MEGLPWNPYFAPLQALEAGGGAGEPLSGILVALFWSALALFTLAIATVALMRIRRRRVEIARRSMDQAHAALDSVDSRLKSFTSSGSYIPEGVRRSLHAELTDVVERHLSSAARSLRRSHDEALRRQLHGLRSRGDELRQTLQGHNDAYVERMVASHSKLLLQELKLDEAQRKATVRDDVRNLVIAGAGSGKTRTIVARVRFLLERGVPARAILAVTFTNKATEEMEERLKQMGVPVADGRKEGVTVSTLHSLGKRVVQASHPGQISVADDRWTDSLVAAALRDAREGRDPLLSQLYFNAILNFHRNEDEAAATVGGERMYRTLRGEHVRSIGERIVADFLFIHNVGYKYEARASWAEVESGRDAYHPDFKLLDPEAYIEYWGINRAGEVAPWMDATSEEYRQGMVWKGEQFRRQGKVLIEFFDYERTEGTLEAVLRERLTRAGVRLRPMTLEDLEKVLGDVKYIGSSIEKLLTQFIANARALRRGPEEIRQRLKGGSPRVRHFGLLGAAVLERYQAQLASEGRIDFSDMLHRAADILEEGGMNPLPQFGHILVDEFQDTSPAMARLIKALIARNGSRLFAVGDDWQAIYGFAGGDVDYIVNFESHFGPSSTTVLNVNYRSPAVIVKAGAALIARNEKQVPKQVSIFSRQGGEAYVHEVPDDGGALVSHTVRLLQGELHRHNPEDILVLSRTNHILGDVAEACRRSGIPVANPEREGRGVRTLSAHKAKGLEAPVVIVVNASDHLFGFPSKVENPDVLEPVRMSGGDDEAEERRLFYVAITRAMERLHLIVRRGLPSPYLAEIEGAVLIPREAKPAGIPVGARFSGLFYVDRLYPVTERQAKAGIRQCGLLATNDGRLSFTSWVAFDLREGATYWLKDVMKDRPYRHQQHLRLDQRTSVELRSHPQTGPGRDGFRELNPLPPPSHQPLILDRPPARS